MSPCFAGTGAPRLRDACRSRLLKGRTPTCSACDALCCRLTVVLDERDRVAPHLTSHDGNLLVMARNEDGWCVAVDMAHMRCSIYDSRPGICRKFAMAGPYCRSIQPAANAAGSNIIPLTLY